ncbi:hypothetical protein [Daejeonella lutea]|uniref:Uncharacterized protein n=1 Tax=Daejeonella lutea TaxID=572036 RepID=A0A1T5DY52_9SPHI|nr:hypothetical protein [Daejeonella lutea]SKB76499.1 hypothetical protein SAMN05661099_2720 [Daejeonella lutea]
MEQKTSQELKKLFSDFIYNPAAINADDSGDLAHLLEKYPYSHLLRAFYTRSLESDPAKFQTELAKAALYSTDRTVLKRIIEDPLSFKSSALESKSIGAEKGEFVDEKNRDEASGTYDSDEPHTEQDIEKLEEPLSASDSMHTSHQQDDVSETDSEDLSVSTDKLEAEDITREPEIEEFEETEIGSILADQNESEEVEVQEPVGEQDEVGNPIEDGNDLAGNLVDSLVNDSENNLPSSSEQDELDLLIKQSAASADFLKDEHQLDDLADRTEEVFIPELDIAEKISHNAVIEDHQDISRYDDDKMPYSFLWWLSKTRKEHTDNYQPYVSFQLDTSQSIKRTNVDQLSSQIIENIFHLQSPVDDMENSPKTVPFQVKRKEDFILEKFIREEPQIKPPNSEKLDNENKARKSAEDPNDLVSETLAQIYTDQMLFHKAIDTYKKLSLKFPEKSTYFADQIRELEKKVN